MRLVERSTDRPVKLVAEPWFWPVMARALVFSFVWWCIGGAIFPGIRFWLRLFTAGLLGFISLVFFDAWRAKHDQRAIGEQTRKRFEAREDAPEREGGGR
jgi:hypothetical protein